MGSCNANEHMSNQHTREHTKVIFSLSEKEIMGIVQLNNCKKLMWYN